MSNHPNRNRHYFEARAIEAGALMAGPEGTRLLVLYQNAPTLEHAEAICQHIALGIFPSTSREPEDHLGVDGADMLYACLADSYAPGSDLVAAVHRKQFPQETVAQHNRWQEVKRLLTNRGCPTMNKGKPAVAYDEPEEEWLPGYGSVGAANNA